MAIAINGSGTMTGISVGGLPDGIVDSGTLATNSVDSDELINGAIDSGHLASGVGGKVLQCLSQVYSTGGNTTNTFPNDNSKPQITEGVEIMTQAITPANSSNILIIQGVVNIGTATTGNTIMVALFQDSTANCLSAWNHMPHEHNACLSLSYFYRMVAGTTSSTTFKIRYAGQGDTTHVNQLSGGNTYNSSYNSTMCVSEISA